MDEMSPVQPPPALEALEVVVTLHDAETGAILEINERMEELYGYSRAELRQMDPEGYLADRAETTPQELAGRFQRAAAGEPQTFELHIERANGELMWARVSLERTTVGGTECVLSEVREITEYKERERRIRLFNRVLRHNLRNRMTVIIGHAETLADAISDEALTRQSEIIRETALEVARLRDRIERIEDVAYGDDTGRSRTELAAVVADVVASFRDSHPEADLSLDVNAEPEVHADEGLHHAISEAIDNAVRHSNGDPSVYVRVGVAPCNEAEVTVADDGPPIPEMEVQAIENESSVDDTSHGTGVGLWVMKRCIESLGGDISIERIPPSGNRLRIRLPAA